MKKLLLLALLVLPCAGLFAQQDTSMIGKMIVVELYSGGEQKGTLMADDGREITIMTTDRGKIIIPKYQVKSMRLINGQRKKDEDYIRQNEYGNNYQFFSNAVPYNENEVTLRMPLFAAFIVDIGITEEFSVSFGSIWFSAYGLTGTYRKALGNDHHLSFSLGAGGMLARFGRNSSYNDLSGLLFKGCYSIGTKEKNFSFGLGYGSTFSGNVNSIVFHTGGLVQLNQKIAMTVEGMMAPKYSAGQGGWALRIRTKKDNCWDLGVHFVLYEEEYVAYSPTGQTYLEKGISGFGFPFVGYMHKF